jgi:hypothetical protein
MSCLRLPITRPGEAQSGPINGLYRVHKVVLQNPGGDAGRHERHGLSQSEPKFEGQLK